jgi:purine nucleosidase
MQRLHLDTDLGGDIDDLCALAMVLNWPGIELAGVTTVSDDGGRRAGYARYALDLAGRNDIPVAAGADVSRGYYHRWQPGFAEENNYWPELIAPICSRTEEAIDMLEGSVQEGATIVAIGPFTNLALLEQRSPGILRSAHLFLMGGYVYPPRDRFPPWRYEHDYNVQADPGSALIVLEHSSPTLVTLSVTVETALRRAYLPVLRDASPLGRLIARQAEAFARDEQMEARFGAACDRVPDDIINFLHDPLACGIALGWDQGVEIREVPLRCEIKEGWLRQAVDARGKPARVVTRVDGPQFSEFWLRMVARRA